MRFRRVVASLRSPKYASPFFAGRHPFQLFLLSLSFLSGLPLVLSLGSSSDKAVPTVSAFIWGLMLVVGSLTTLLGTYWPTDVVTRMTIERIGLTAVGYGALLFGSVTVISVSTPSAPVALEVVVLIYFAWTCLIRSRDIDREIRIWVIRASGAK